MSRRKHHERHRAVPLGVRLAENPAPKSMILRIGIAARRKKKLRFIIQV
jgi:3-methyladenine DNA glycosylase Mpg